MNDETPAVYWKNDTYRGIIKYGMYHPYVPLMMTGRTITSILPTIIDETVVPVFVEENVAPTDLNDDSNYPTGERMMREHLYFKVLTFPKPTK